MDRQRGGETIAKPPLTRWENEIDKFKRKLLTDVLTASQGNRTHAAQFLGLQRTYLQRLIRCLGVTVPPPRQFAYRE